MESKWCFECGASNTLVAEVCVNCGSPLPSKNEYREHLAELNEFREVKKDYGPGNLIGILIAIALVWLVANVILVFLIPATSTDALESWPRTWIVPIVVLIMFFGLFVPRLVKWIRVRRRRHWSRHQRTVLTKKLKVVPVDAFRGISTVALPAQTTAMLPSGSGTTTQMATRKSNAPGCGVIAGVMVLVGIVIYVVLSTNGTFKPENIFNWFNPDVPSVIDGETATVSGRYEAYFAGQSGDGGALDASRAEQTWWYDFFSDGTYTTYIDGYQQFSGTWSQSGDVLTINTPAIPEGGIAAQSYTATVAPDASSFTTPDSTWNRIPQ